MVLLTEAALLSVHHNAFGVIISQCLDHLRGQDEQKPGGCCHILQKYDEGCDSRSSVVAPALLQR